MIGILESKRGITPRIAPIVGTPVSWYKMDEASGVTVIDEMGNYNGTNFGATQGLWGKFIKSYGYSSGAIYSNLLPSSVLIPTLTSSFSINVWIYPTFIGSAVNAERAVSVFRTSGLNSVIILGCHLTNKSYAYIGGANYDIGTVNLDEWVMLTLTYDGTVGRTYQNGVLIGTHTKTLNGAGFNIPVQLSKSDAGVFNGRIDTSYFWKSKLTDAQVMQLYIN